MDLFDQAAAVYEASFPMETWFERALFFSWYCSIRDCTFCFMSAQPKNIEPKTMRRSTESLLAEAILCRVLGWDSGFLSGGINAFTPADMKQLLPTLTAAYGNKFWLNVGPLPRNLLESYRPYLSGVVGALETVNPLLHKKICPSKPMEPYLRMFDEAHALGLQNAMTFIVGVGETKEDLPLLLEIIQRYHISKIHIYSLIPEKGTIYTEKDIPEPLYQAWWIAQVRVHCPTISIQCGIWKDRIAALPILLKAGANSFSKFPATRLFGTARAHDVEQQVACAGRSFRGTLTKLPVINWEDEVQRLPVTDAIKQRVHQKLHQYLGRMQRNVTCGSNLLPVKTGRVPAV
ncbi:radical SAM protein [Candidatus Woesearchaeota archaeon]|nr:radical SAM protein [Candidatus Woesearchaeota archaeon]